MMIVHKMLEFALSLSWLNGSWDLLSGAVSQRTAGHCVSVSRHSRSLQLKNENKNAAWWAVS